MIRAKRGKKVKQKGEIGEYTLNEGTRKPLMKWRKVICLIKNLKKIIKMLNILEQISESISTETENVIKNQLEMKNTILK